ncbi:TAXI family TRAP transporter solute-binding subunit [Spongorhabdus nitratireducens]
MRKLMTPLCAAFSLASALALSGGAQAAAQTTHVSIGTGGVTGVYYPTGSAMCKLVNRGTKQHGIRCSVEATGGSVYNINTIRAGELDLGVAQSDQQFNAWNGEGAFKAKGEYKDLRSVFSVYTEAFTVVARKDADIKTFEDLKGKRVNVGNPGSGQRATMEALMAQKGWTMDAFKLVSELKAAEQAQALCDNKIDAMVYFAGHPNGAIQEATTSCDANIVAADDKATRDMVAEKSYLVSYKVPGGLYKGNDADIPTLGAKATFVTSVGADEESIYQLTKSVFENFDRFKRLHPAFASLDPKDMVSDGNTAPLHPGAARYFREAGLLN